MIYEQSQNPGKRFSADAGQPPNHSLGLAQVTKLLQLALMLSSTIADLEARVKKENQVGRISLSLSEQIQDMEKRQQRIEKIEAMSAEIGENE